MNTENNKTQSHTAPMQFGNLEELAAYKQELMTELGKCEIEIKDTWNKLFHTPERKAVTPTQKFLAMASNSAAIIDGAILGWKLYNKFRRR